ncbi:MAG: 2-dehydropantoate 2-reductase [Chloroflexi bacterium]|nr:2-dehydropantoate 2-reductase [Chloroflexota bacterium]
MRIAVFGAGSLGGFLGARLAHAGEEVAFIARGDTLRTIREHGLRVESPQGDFVAHPALATDLPAQAGVADAVVVGVKAWQVPEAAQAIRPLVGEHTAVLPVQNGVEAPFQLAAVLGKEHVLGGAITVVVQTVAPGHVQHVTPGADLSLGELDNRRSQRVERLRDAFLRARINAVIPADIQAALWAKLLYIAAMSGLGAVTRAPLGAWRAIPETRAMAQEAMQEVFAVASARGILLSEGVVREMMAVADRFPAESTTSMYRDIAAGRPSELDFINGSVVRLGAEAGVPTPVNAFIYHSLLPQERMARGMRVAGV